MHMVGVEKSTTALFTCIIHAIHSGQIQGVERRRHRILFQGFRNEADGLQ